MIESTGNLTVLPKGWVSVQLGKILSLSKEKVEPRETDNLPYIGLEHIEKGSGRLLGHGSSSDVKSTKARFYEGDILYGKLRPYLNKVYMATFEGVCSTDILVFPRSKYLSGKYILFRLLCPDFVRFANLNVSGVQHPRVNFKTLCEFPVNFAPLAEQKRIVAKIEELFTRLDAGVEALKKVKAELKRYRQAVLKYAFEGKLTDEWREKNKDKLEPASKLLECIAKEREKNAKGKTKKLPPLDTSELPELPTGWEWVTMSQVGELNRGKSRHRPRDAPHLYGGKYPFVQTGDIRNAKGIIKEYTQTYSEEGLRQSRLWPKGTLCITIAANIADTAFLGFDACIPDSVVGFRTDERNCNTKFVEFFLRTAKANLERYAPATAQKNINLAILSVVAMPFPPLLEQTQIVAEIERHFSITDEVEQTIEKSIKESVRLHQSILKRAFEGKLVPQDPNDEPAEKLLKSIKAEKTKLQADLKLRKSSMIKSRKTK